jgi:hypothetical protein
MRGEARASSDWLKPRRADGMLSARTPEESSAPIAKGAMGSGTPMRRALWRQDPELVPMGFR